MPIIGKRYIDNDPATRTAARLETYLLTLPGDLYKRHILLAGDCGVGKRTLVETALSDGIQHLDLRAYQVATIDLSSRPTANGLHQVMGRQNGNLGIVMPDRATTVSRELASIDALTTSKRQLIVIKNGANLVYSGEMQAAQLITSIMQTGESTGTRCLLVASKRELNLIAKNKDSDAAFNIVTMEPFGSDDSLRNFLANWDLDLQGQPQTVQRVLSTDAIVDLVYVKTSRTVGAVSDVVRVAASLAPSVTGITIDHVKEAINLLRRASEG